MIKFLSKTSPENLRGTALLRLDFNTEDDWRMETALPTVRFLLKHSSKIVIISHRGRPLGRDRQFSLKHDAGHLARLLKKGVAFLPLFNPAAIKKAIEKAPKGSILLLENLRFMKGEEKNDAALAKQLASFADFYVNDAFAVSHRANASVAAITRFLPSYAGLEMEKEIKFLGEALRHPKRPLVFILGGAKAADKLGIIKYFKNKADWFLLGGGPANTLLWLRGMDVKNSVKDADPKDRKALMAAARLSNVLLPVDFVWHKDAILDLGPKTITQFSKKIAGARTIVWSGPVGLIEKKAYAKGSIALARAVARNPRALSISGGGETVMFFKKYGFDKKFSFISTGGGAMIDFLAGKKLPGIEALRTENRK